MFSADVLHWLSQQAETSSTIDDLVEQGCMGCSLQDLMPWLSDREVFERIAAITWQKSAREPDGEVALMTADIGGLDGLLEWMLENRGECPKVYAPDDDPEVPAAIPGAATVSPAMCTGGSTSGATHASELMIAPELEAMNPESLPLDRPTAYNLPEGMRSRDVMDDAFVGMLEEIFADLKNAFGERAHLYRIDYSTFVEYVENEEVVVLTGEFVDLEDGEIYRFTMDGVQQRMRYESTGRYHASTKAAAEM